MNTRQKLTLGIAAIFMVTLTIVGVTYAYFVTRVVDPTNGKASAKLETVQLGSIKYVEGNEIDGENDFISLTDVQPGAIIYKTFAVENTSEAGALASNYFITLSNSVAATPDGADYEVGEFIHTADGKNEGTVLTTCYSKLSPTTELADGYTKPVDLKTSTTGGDPSCFVPTETGKSYYNNIAVTLYKVEKGVYEGYETNNRNDEAYVTNTTNTAADPESSTYEEEIVLEFDKQGQVVSDQMTIEAKAEGATENTFDYYVLKVEYVNEKTLNQNAENNAGLDIVVSIKA